MNVLEQLLSKGFFPIQLPPNFTSVSFGEKHDEVSKGIDKIISNDKKKNPMRNWTRTEKYSVARSSYSRRTTNILNPISYFVLARLICNQWDEINEHYDNSNISLSRPSVDGQSIRAITITKFSELYEKKLVDSSGYKYALITDISSYFPSIYTHSISWALDGKESSKRNLRGSIKSLGDDIDLLCRNAQDGQTIGLPIGCDTSHIISELIGTAIDVELTKKLKESRISFSGFRYVDDFFLFFSSRTKAEKALAILTTIISNYELEINAIKTKVIESKDLIDESWRYSVKKLMISYENKSQRNDIHNYFSAVFSLEKKYKDESIAKYSMKQLSSHIIKRDNWDIFESYLLKTAYSFPNTIEILARFLSTYNKFNYNLNIDNIKRFINSMLSEHANSFHHNEVCWILWLAKELNIKPSKVNVMRVLNMDSNICTLMILDMINKRLINKKYISDDVISKYTGSDELTKEGWIVSYEAGKRKWLGNSDLKFIKRNREFKILLDNGVSFYDENADSPVLFFAKDSVENIDELLSGDDDLSDSFEFNEIDDEYFDNNNNELNNKNSHEDWDDDY
ncbi:RNA-directed DNA polymerase [Providencia manganoxydans]|uniref:RNA-directed DNA polymerase n=1 Tax=Providencia manganoxydans TaxID=2923283 RepID=UPI0034E577B1